MKLNRLLLLLPILLIAAACASRAAYPPPQPYPPPTGQQPPDTQTPPPAVPEPSPPDNVPAPPRTAAEVSGPAVVALMSRAEQRAQGGDLDSAAASLERALDLEPRNPFVYQRLAAMRLQQGQPQQGEALARKANSLAGENPYLRSGNWRLIAKARSVQGDSVGASSASSRADYYQSQGQQLNSGRR